MSFKQGGSFKFDALKSTGNDDDTPAKDIFDAAERGKAGWIRNLLDRTVEFDVNQTDSLLRTPLHWAAELGHIEAAEALLDYGCEVAKKECNGRTAVHLAARSADAEMLKTLMEGVDADERKRLANETDNFGITPVSLAYQKIEEVSTAKDALAFLMECGGKYSTNVVASRPTEE